MLKSVGIKNFRSCHETNFEFGRGLRAICGRNGVGKSNILKAIEWACSTAISAEGVKLAPAGNTKNDPGDTSIQFEIVLDDLTYYYNLQVSAYNRLQLNPRLLGSHGLLESLELDDGGHRQDIFRRQGEAITLGDMPDIRIARTTPALAALFSLLTSDHPYRNHIDRIMSFFGGIRYYSLLDDRPDARDYVTELAYNEWKFRYESEGALTSSLAMRLIYMWQEQPELFGELITILGPDGLDIIEHIDIVPIDQTGPLGTPKDGAALNIKLFIPRLKPAAHMGGAGGYFSFSELSIGTRRVVRIIASMLFDKRSLMLMEQPEDSIHPGLLRKLIDQLRTYSYDTQMLFTTHSLEVLDILHPEEVLLATATGGSTKLRNLSQDQIARAKVFLQNEGSLSDFLEPLDDL